MDQKISGALPFKGIADGNLCFSLITGSAPSDDPTLKHPVQMYIGFAH